MSQKRIYELDALRGIAALMVVLFHYTINKNTEQSDFGIGCAGVDLFFIISGFVIILTIENTSNWKSFLINRFSRLFPAYWVCVTLTTISIALAYYFNIITKTEPDLVLRYFINLTMFQYYFNTTEIDGSYWTLIIELLFYFFILLFIIFNKKQYIELIGAICLILPLCNRLFIDELLAHETIFRITNSIPLLIYFPLFYSGIIFYKIKFDKKTSVRWVLLIISYIIQLYIFDRLYNNRGFLSYQEYVLSITIFYIVFILFVFNKLNFISNKITLWLGNISFVLYLIHQFIGSNIIIPILTNTYHLNTWLAISITLIFMLAISFLIMFYIEKPCLIAIRKKYSTKMYQVV